MRQTVAMMGRLARAASVDPLVRHVAMGLIDGISGRDSTAQIQAIRNWLAARWEFVRDPTGAEAITAPADLLRGALTPTGHVGTLRGDCDDVATMAAALGRAIGLRARFVVVGFSVAPQSAPYRHVWAELSGPTLHPQWVELDVTRGQQDLPPTVARWLIIPT